MITLSTPNSTQSDSLLRIDKMAIWSENVVELEDRDRGAHLATFFEAFRVTNTLVS